MTTSPLTDQQLDLDRITETVTIATAEAATADLPHGVAAVVEDATALVDEIHRLRDAMGQIWQLHKDSPMGPCPVCIDADAAAAGGDGLVPYPCPTARLAGAQDCDPPSFRAAAVPAAVETGE